MVGINVQKIDANPILGKETVRGLLRQTTESHNLRKIFAKDASGIPPATLNLRSAKARLGQDSVYKIGLGIVEPHIALRLTHQTRDEASSRTKADAHSGSHDTGERVVYNPAPDAHRLSAVPAGIGNRGEKPGDLGIDQMHSLLLIAVWH